MTIEVVDKDVEELQAKYNALCHAVQSGVAMEMNTPQGGAGERGSCGPKHLRTGVNIALVETGALGRVLVHKGIITEREYWEAMVEAMEAEVARYEAAISQRTGGNVKLG